MSLTVNAKTYTADSFAQNVIGYVGPAKTVSVKDDIKLSRIRPTAIETSSGVGQVSCKLTRTETLTGAVEPMRDQIHDLSHRIPVGTTAANVDTALNDLAAFVGSAAYKAFVKAQLISQ